MSDDSTVGDVPADPRDEANVDANVDANAPATAGPAEGPATTPDARPAIPHVPALDGLRGVAVAGVVANHLGKLTGGWLGVDLFFVLSGYLITTILLMEARRSQGATIGLGRFWSRRVRRLGPALVLTLVGVAAYAKWAAMPIERWGIRWDGIATLFEVANWRNILAGGSYWTSFLPPSPLNHTWSLSIEEQLYLLWPLVVVLLVVKLRRRAGTVAVVAGIGAALSVATMLALQASGAANIRLYEGTDTRAAAVLLGAAVAALRLHLGPRRWRRTAPIRLGLALVALVPLGVLWWSLDGATRTPYRGLLPLASVCGALVVAGFTDRREGGLAAQVLSLPPLTWLGRVSYGVYLYHWPLFLWLSPERVGWSGWRLDLLRLAVTIVVAWLSFVLVEMPVRRGRLTGRQARAAVPAGVAIVVIALLAATLNAHPVPSSYKWSRYVVRAANPLAPTVVYAGDSVPFRLSEELYDQVNLLDVSAASVANPACHPLAPVGPIRGLKGDVSTDTTDCRRGGQLREWIRGFQPTVSILLFGGYPNESVKIDGTWRMQCDPEYDAAYERQVRLTVEDLEVTGGRVVLATSPSTNLSWVIDNAPAGFQERMACRNRIMRKVAAEMPHVGLVDLAGYICPPGEPCKQEIDGVNLREDGLHFTGRSAALINDWLIPRAIAAAAAA